MKKIFTLIAAMVCVISSYAKDYTDYLTVSINGTATEQKATVSVEEAAGSYTFTLKNLVLSLGGQPMPIGTIKIDNLKLTTLNGQELLMTQRNITLENGDDPTYEGQWMGPMLQEVPIDFIARVSDERVYASIGIKMVALNQTIEVTFGSGYQIPNSSFEAFHKEGKIDEPNNWHSFASAGGSLASMVKGTPHTFISDIVRPGSTGKSSVKLASTSIFGIIANGTMTTGRMIAGAFSATDKANHAELDMTKKELDSNKDPFYVTLNGEPDSLAVWVKFTQGKPQPKHPYATVSAYITDGNYFQDPTLENQNNYSAVAINKTIESKGGEWQRISIPFNYVDTGVEGKAILVTLSTNADAGQGSGNDELYVDDLSLIYKAEIASVKLNGEKVEVEVKGNGAFANTVYSEKDGKKIATVTAYSVDLKPQQTKEYDLSVLAGINTVGNNDSHEVKAIYTLKGEKVSTMRQGGVYIVRYADGTARKVVK